MRILNASNPTDRRGTGTLGPNDALADFFSGWMFWAEVK